MGRKQTKAAASAAAPVAKRLSSPRPPIAKTDAAPRFASAITAPPPTALPKPPASWTSRQPAMEPPPVVLQHSDAVQKQLQGNLLFSLLAPRCGALTAKVTGMLLELDAAEREELLSQPSVFEERIEEAFSVLRDAGDPRVPSSTAAGAGAAPLFTVDVDAASSLAALSLRISPRRSSNPYATGNILLSPTMVSAR